MRRLVTQAAYAKTKGVSREAVSKRTVLRGGTIPVHGPRKLIDADEADRLWDVIDPGQIVAGNGKRSDDPADDDDSDYLDLPGEIEAATRGLEPAAKAKVIILLARAQSDLLALEREKGTLVDKLLAVRQLFDFMRMERDAWLGWPARIGAILAAELNVDAHALTMALERAVREQLTELSRQPKPKIGVADP